MRQATRSFRSRLATAAARLLPSKLLLLFGCLLNYHNLGWLVFSWLHIGHYIMGLVLVSNPQLVRSGHQASYFIRLLFPK
jgi:hypothetical protein